MLHSQPESFLSQAPPPLIPSTLVLKNYFLVKAYRILKGVFGNSAMSKGQRDVDVSREQQLWLGGEPWRKISVSFSALLHAGSSQACQGMGRLSPSVMSIHNELMSQERETDDSQGNK